MSSRLGRPSRTTTTSATRKRRRKHCGSPTTQTLRIANDARITAKRCPLCRHGRDGQLDPFLASFMQGAQTFADPYRGKYSLYWLTIRDGQVAAIDEQYVP